MSGIIGPLTGGRIALALGAVGVGGIIGGVIADRTDRDVTKGVVIGGASALAGLALLYGGAAAWQRFTAARAGAATGATQLGSTLPRLGPPAPVTPLTRSIPPAFSTNVGTALGRVPTPAITPSITLAPTSTQGTWSSIARTLFGEPSAVATLRPLAVAVPSHVATPMLPIAASGSTFLTALGRFAT